MVIFSHFHSGISGCWSRPDGFWCSAFTLEQHSVLNAISELISVTCNECMFDAIHDLWVLDYVNNVNVHSKPKLLRTKRRKCGNLQGKFTLVLDIIHRSFKLSFGICTRASPSTSWGNALSSPTLLLNSWVLSDSGMIMLQKSKGQFCDSDLEVAFQKQTCNVRDLEGVDLLKGLRGLNLYTMSLKEMMKSSSICLLSKASKTKSWLWHLRLSHLNFGYINELAKQGLVRGLPKLKYQKDNLCSAYFLGKSKKHTHKPKADDSIQEKLYLLHMDLCGLMRLESIDGKKYIWFIVDDYSRFTWVKFLRLKDETAKIVIKLLKKIQVRLNATVRNIRTDNETEFVNQTLQAVRNTKVSVTSINIVR
ncbi:retrovirus-related pol polyprotein from transposon TNT 1-94 [Tanacetum coccineum]